MLKQWFNTLWLLLKRHYIFTFSIVLIICISVGIALSFGDKAYIYKDSVERDSKIVKGSIWYFYTFKYNINGIDYSFKYIDFGVCSCNKNPSDKLSKVSYKLDKYLEKGYFRIMKSDLRIALCAGWWMLTVLIIPLIGSIFFSGTYNDRFSPNCHDIYSSRKLVSKSINDRIYHEWEYKYCDDCKFKLYCKHTKYDTPLNKLQYYWEIFLGYHTN